MGKTMIISGAIVCDANGERHVDVRIEDDRIVEVGQHLSGGEIIDGSGCYLLPGLVDTNVRLKDGNLNGKNLESLSRYALSGGVTTVVLASDSQPRIDNEITLEFVNQHRHSPQGAVIENCANALNEEGALSNIAILLKKGSAAVYTSTLGDYNLISRISQYLKMADKPLFYKAEDSSLFESGVMADGRVASELGLPGISPLGEVVHIASMIEVARYFDIQVIFQSVTEPRSIELISNAAQEGVKVSCEVSIHHLLRSDEACRGFDTDAKINPPLLSEAKRLALIEALQKDKIHSLTALHQPNSDVNKDITFYDAAYGTTSIAEYLQLCYTYLVQTNIISMAHLMKLAAFQPAHNIGIKSGLIEEGFLADMVLFDPKGVMAVSHHHSLYKNETLSGKIVMNICRGQVTRY